MKAYHISVSLLLLAAGFLAVGAVAEASAAEYRVVDLAGANNYLSDSVGRAINDSGQATGRVFDSEQTQLQASFWPALSSNPKFLLGATSAYGINNQGQKIGASNELSEVIGEHRAVFWPSGSARAQTLASPPNLGANGLAVNRSGQMVGNISNATATFIRAVFWQNGGSLPVVLAGLPGLPDSALGAQHCLSDAGEVVGEASNADFTVFRATYWASSTSPAVDLGGLPGGFTNSEAAAINNVGGIVGNADLPDFSQERAVVWTSSSSSGKDLGAIGPEFPNATARGINDAGEIVGFVYNSDFSVEHAVRWRDSSSPAEDLNDLIDPNSGWVLERAVAINRSGLIVGQGTINGHLHGFVLIPRRGAN